MNALSLKQPWASLLAGGEKKVETRAWRTHATGRIVIHASKTFDEFDQDLLRTRPFSDSLIRLGFDKAGDLPLGAIIGLGSLQGCLPAVDARKTITDKEAAFGNYEMGRWAWVFVDLCVFEVPIPCRGYPGLWTVPTELLTEIERQRARS